MGISHMTCCATGLGICIEDVSVVLVGVSEGGSAPVALPIYGNYDSYGSIEKPGLRDIEQPIVRGFVKLRKQGELQLSEANEVGESIDVQNLRAVLEDIRQGSIYEGVRGEGTVSQLVRARGVPLGFVFILEEVYDELVSQARAAAGDERLDALTDGGFPELLSAAFGSTALPAELTEDTIHVRNALADWVVFRERFGVRCQWEPAAAGHQFTRRELRTRLDQARASWPELRRVFERYKRKAFEPI